MDGYMELKSFGTIAAASLIAAGLAGTAVPATLLANPLMEAQAAASAPAPLPSVSSRALSGATADQPFVSNQTGLSQHYRIPSIITLDNGWLLAGADARWGVYGDSPENLDGLVSISKDGGKTWEWELVNEFVDYPSQNGGHKGNSASFIDPTFIQGGDGTVYMMADAWPAGTGIWGTGGASCESTGFDGNGNFLISRGKAGAIAGLDADRYTYYCDAAAKQTFSVDGAQVELVPIKDKDGALTGSWVDAYFDLYTVADGAASRTVVKQHESGKDIQANVFYSQSEWKAYPTCYIWLVKGTPTQDGIDWGEPSILNVKRKDDQPFTGICPGRGLVVPLQGGGERIMFQIYESKQGGNESASAIWSDDAGATWQRGERSNKFNGSGKSSESQTVMLPGGGVRMYSRNSAGAISYADSFDNGQTWSAYTLDTELQYTGNCMVSFINVDGCLVDAQGRVWSNLVAASYPKTSGRRDGAVRIGSIDAATNKVTWLNANDIKFPGRFLYSCLTQVDGDKMAIVYEQQEPKSDGTQDVIFNQFSLLDLLGEGWSYSAATPALAVSNMVEALDVDEEIELSAAVDGVDAVEYTWTVEQPAGNDSADSAPAAKIDAAGASATLTGANAGKARVKVVAAFDLNGAKAHLEASWDVYVSSRGATVLPDRLGTQEVNATYEAPYTLATQLPKHGVYLIHGQEDGGRIMYNLPGDGAPDRLRSSISNNAVTPDTSGKFPIANQVWKIDRTGDGYAIASVADGRKLSITAGDNGFNLELGDTGSIFAIEGEGTAKTVSTTVGDKTVYIGMGAKGAFVAGETPYNKISLGLGVMSNWTVSTTLISSVLDEANAVTNDDAYMDESWKAFTAARDEAKAALDSCLETYDTEAAAEQQKDLLDNAAKKLFRAQRDLAAKPLPEPDPEPQPQPQPQPQPDRDNIKVETDEAGNKVTTTTHKDGTSTVDITAPDGVSTTIELDKDGDATAISATVPASVAKSGRATLPLKHAIAGASGADAPAITIDIAGAAPARPLQVSLDSQDSELAPGTVAVLVDANGNEKVLAKTALANNRVSFPIENDATIKIVDRGKSFEDVRETDWFAQEVVGYASARGIINGVPGERGALQFQGNAAASRAMFVCMLANLEDARKDQPQSAFTDVAQSDWFANGAAWGSENGIVAGYGDGSVFGGEDPVTREQVAVFLMRYATMLGLDTSARVQPTHPDAGSTSQFAADAMQWAVAEGLILGNGSGMLNPASTATRAEVAAILARFINTQLA